jgi:hypothetical protein
LKEVDQSPDGENMKMMKNKKEIVRDDGRCV